LSYMPTLYGRSGPTIASSGGCREGDYIPQFQSTAKDVQGTIGKPLDKSLIFATQVGVLEGSPNRV